MLNVSISHFHRLWVKCGNCAINQLKKVQMEKSCYLNKFFTGFSLPFFNFHRQKKSISIVRLFLVHRNVNIKYLRTIKNVYTLAKMSLNWLPQFDIGGKFGRKLVTREIEKKCWHNISRNNLKNFLLIFPRVRNILCELLRFSSASIAPRWTWQLNTVEAWHLFHSWRVSRM